MACRNVNETAELKVGWAPTLPISVRIARSAPFTLPSRVPPTLICGDPPNAELRRMFDQSSLGPFGAQDCQPLITWLACDHGHSK
jgi:hypothetical protein